MANKRRKEQTYAICSVCDESYEWGDDLCEHLRKEFPDFKYPVVSPVDMASVHAILEDGGLKIVTPILVVRDNRGRLWARKEFQPTELKGGTPTDYEGVPISSGGWWRLPDLPQIPKPEKED